MKITFAETASAEALAFAVYDKAKLSEQGEALDQQTGGALKKALKAARFEGKSGQVRELIGLSGVEAERLAAAGMGEAKDLKPLSLQQWAGALVHALLTGGAKKLSILMDEKKLGDVGADEAAARAGLGALLASYRFDGYRTKLADSKKPTLGAVEIVCADPKAAKKAFAALEAQYKGVELARDLVNEPPNVIYPESFAKEIKKLEKAGIEVEILGQKEMAKLGMNALLGVGQGSARESQLGIMRWKGGKGEGVDLALVGKGVTFDTGGVSLKPGQGMEEMKGDMGGAAAVTGAMLALASRKAKANVVGLVGLVENMPDGNAQRPGDIVTAADGQTIEIQNTDAEGRLVLADVLWYAQEHEGAKEVVDLATLTGACVIALGNEYAGFYATDDALAEHIFKAGEAEGEPAWRMPLGAGYDKLIDSAFADMKNIGGRWGGSITAAQFLKRFIREGVTWAHLDIAGTAWKEKQGPLEPVWGTGYGVRLLDRLVKDRFES